MDTGGYRIPSRLFRSKVLWFLNVPMSLIIHEGGLVLALAACSASLFFFRL
jgi:hypothetical protein